MIRLLPVVLILVIAYFVITSVLSAGSTVVERPRRARRARGPYGARDWDKRSDQIRRQVRGVQGPPEHRDEMVAFIESHGGVEAYIEPKTMVSPMSVVLVDRDGEWRRFELREDRFLRQLGQTHRLRTFDASIVGYPPRMRRAKGSPPPHHPPTGSAGDHSA